MIGQAHDPVAGPLLQVTHRSPFVFSAQRWRLMVGGLLVTECSCLATFASALIATGFHHTGTRRFVGRELVQCIM